MRLIGQFSTFYFFIQKDYTHTKSTKKHKKAPKSIEKPKGQRPNQVKAQNVNKSIVVALNL